MGRYPGIRPDYPDPIPAALGWTVSARRLSEKIQSGDKQHSATGRTTSYPDPHFRDQSASGWYGAAHSAVQVRSHRASRWRWLELRPASAPSEASVLKAGSRVGSPGNPRVAGGLSSVAGWAMELKGSQSWESLSGPPGRSLLRLHTPIVGASKQHDTPHNRRSGRVPLRAWILRKPQGTRNSERGRPG